MVYVFLADGFEEIEALAVVDVLRRASIEVSTVGVTGKNVTSSRGITVIADTTEVVLDENLEMMVLPGGMPGTLNLDNSEAVHRAIDFCLQSNTPMAAICAAPTIYGKRGLLKGKKAVCYPGMEKDLLGAELVSDGVCVDSGFITSKSAGYAVDFALAIAEYLRGSSVADKVSVAMYHN